MQQKRKNKLATNLILAFLILMAAFFRLHRLDELPPGLHHDEAVNGLDALMLAREGGLPLYFPENYGREPLHIYLQAAAIALLGPRLWTLRLVSAYAGILTIPLLYGLALELFGGEGLDKRRHLGLTAAAVLSIAYWHVNFSRIAFRAIVMLPPLILALWLWLRGRRRQRYRYFAGAGAALGVSLYTYLPAYLTPFLLIALIPLHYVTFPGGNKRQMIKSTQTLLKGSLITGLATILVFAPLGIYFLTHTGNFGRRSGQVSVLTYSVEQGIPAAVLLADHIWQTGRMFLDKGHKNPVLNLPGSPALSWPLLLGFWMGVWAALRRIRRFHYAFLLIWFVIMLAPTYLSNEPAHPLRALGVLPAATLLVSAGFVQAGDWIQRRWAWAQSRWVWPVYFLLILLVSGGLTYRNYFQQLPRTIALREHFAVAETNIAQRMLRQPPTILAAAVYEYPTTQFILRSALKDIQEAEKPATAASAALVYPANECHLQEKMILFQPGSKTARQTSLIETELNTDNWLTPPGQVASFEDEIGYPLWREFSSTPILPRQTLFPRPVSFNFNFQLCLAGFNVTQPTDKPDSAVTLTLLWEQLTPPLDDYTAAISVEDAFGNIVAQTEGETVISPERERNNGELFATFYTITLPSSAPSGKYRFNVAVKTKGIILPEVPIPLMVFPYTARAETEYVTLGAAVVDPAVIPHSFTVTAGEPPIMRLLGYDLEPDSPKSGEPVYVTLYWQMLQPAYKNYSGFVHLLNENGALIAQQDGEPMNGKAPTSMWLAGEMIADRREILIPPGAADGRYTLAAGFYDWQTGMRLPLVDAAGNRLPDDRLTLPQTIEIGN